MEVKVGACPLGSECEEVKKEEGKQVMYRCPWYIQVRGKHPQTNEDVDQWNCSLSWLPTLLIENAQTNRGQTQALESFRNEMVTSQDTFNNLIEGGMHSAKQLKD